VSLVFAAIVPHSPVLLPAVGKDNLAALAATAEALRTVAAELKATKPDTLVCLSSHLEAPRPAFTFNIQPTYRISFAAFGDYGTNLSVAGDPVFAHYLKRRFDTKRDEFPVAVVSVTELDYSLGVPLSYLLAPQPQLKVVPLGDTTESHRLQFRFGQRLRRSIYQERQRVAVVASANLSHRLSEHSPAGYSPKAKSFDRRVLKAIVEGRPEALARLRTSTVAEVQACGLKAMLLLGGILDELAYRPEVIAYEHPFGIGLPTIVLRC
jgi:aromatic ring-opening dioxygenase LigB subunit